MPSLSNFIQFLAASPPSGLIIADKGVRAKTALDELARQKIPHITVAIDERAAAPDFFRALDQALAQNAWLVLDIKTPDIPGWLYSQFRNIEGSGHAYDHERNRDYPLLAAPVRVLAVMSWKNLDDSPFETFLSCFGIVFRQEAAA